MLGYQSYALNRVPLQVTYLLLHPNSEVDVTDSLVRGLGSAWRTGAVLAGCLPAVINDSYRHQLELDPGCKFVPLTTESLRYLLLPFTQWRIHGRGEGGDRPP